MIENLRRQHGTSWGMMMMAGPGAAAAPLKK